MKLHKFVPFAADHLTQTKVKRFGFNWLERYMWWLSYLLSKRKYFFHRPDKFQSQVRTLKNSSKQLLWMGVHVVFCSANFIWLVQKILQTFIQIMDRLHFPLAIITRFSWHSCVSLNIALPVHSLYHSKVLWAVNIAYLWFDTYVPLHWLDKKNV